MPIVMPYVAQMNPCTLDHLAEELPPPPEHPLTDEVMAGMTAHASTAIPFAGYRDVFGEDGNKEYLAKCLNACVLFNAWPDWLAYYRQAYAAHWPIEQMMDTLEGALLATGWPQTLREVLQEVYCRGRGYFVFQESVPAWSVDNSRHELTVGGVL